jgi:NADP-dependent 3-hydroxy acid dehydrogenase YdfG
MKPVIIVCGHGPGISHAVATRFGKAGHPVAIVARNATRLIAAARELTQAGITAGAFPCDLAEAGAVRAMVAAVRAQHGRIGIIHWNAYASGAGDLVAAPEELGAVLGTCVHGLLAAVAASHGDLQACQGSVLVTGGGFCYYDPEVDAAAVKWGSMGLAVGKAAQHKATGLLHQRLAPDGIYVGEVVISGTVKGTAFDDGTATLEPAAIAERFFELNERRSEATVDFA